MLFLYLSLFTWNLRTGYVDSLAAHVGLEFVGTILKPGKWVRQQVVEFWDHYIDLVDVRRRNDELEASLREAMFAVAAVREDEAELQRLRALLTLAPPEGWARLGARVIAHRLGLQAELESILLDKGYLQGGDVRTPVVTHRGVVGRVFRAGPYSSSVLLVTDPNSRIAVLSQNTRTPGVVMGTGARRLLEMRYVSINAPLAVGELLVTSGQAGAFPKGLPVARVVSIEYSDLSLFQKIMVEPLADLENLEEVLLLDGPPGLEERSVTELSVTPHEVITDMSAGTMPEASEAPNSGEAGAAGAQ